VLDAETGRPLAVLTGHAHRVVTATYSPDGKRIVTASEDNTARVWDTSKELRSADQIAALIRCKGMTRFDREDSSLIVPNMPNPAECLPSLPLPH
jgi:WD40 repeat protein